jgi:CTP synthase
LPLEEHVLEKTALFCDVPLDGVINSYDLHSVYEVPLLLEEKHLLQVLEQRLFGRNKEADISAWRNMVGMKTEKKLTIALVGKYVTLPDAYISVVEAIKHAAISKGAKVEVILISSDNLETASDSVLQETFDGIDGLVIPGGFGGRGIEGMIKVLQYARENKLPTLGICLGMQVMSIEFARNVLQLDGANSTEFDPATSYPVISLLPEQSQIENMGASMRLGAYPCTLIEGTKAQEMYKKPVVFERHRHRFEFNNLFKQKFEENGFIVSGIFEPKNLVEILELKDHPFFVGVQFHPEFKSRPMAPHPLFQGLIAQALERSAL